MKSSFKPRVLALADHLGYAQGSYHGCTTYYLNVYPALVRSGIDLTVAFLGPPHPAAARLRESGIDPIFFDRAKWDFRAYWDLKNLVKRARFDVIHMANHKSQILGRLVARRFGCRCVLHLHDTTPLSAPVSLAQRLVRRDEDIVLAVSDAVGEAGARGLGLRPAQIRTLHNAMDIAPFSAPRPDAGSTLRAELGLDPGTRLVGLVGRLARMKAPDHAIRVMEAVTARCPKARLLVVGDGPLRDTCKQLVVSLGLGEKVLFLGHRDDIPAVLAALDAVVMPSVSGEGLPYVAIEAIASGTPVVAYPTSGIPAVVVDGVSGLLAPHSDMQALGEALVRLLADEELRVRLSDGARSHAQQFTLPPHVAKLTEIYRSLSGSSVERPVPATQSRV